MARIQVKKDVTAGREYMDRKTLEEKGLSADQIDFVMAENGKDVQKMQKKLDEEVAKAVQKQSDEFQKQLNDAQKQIADYESQLKSVEGLDEKTKTQLEQMKKDYDEKAQKQAEEMKKLQEKARAELDQVRRESETKEFLNSLGKKFVTPETALVFEQKINEALLDKSNEGKNRADLFKILTSDSDGNERTDIFVSETIAPPKVTNKVQAPKGQEQTPTNLLDALKMRYGG